MSILEVYNENIIDLLDKSRNLTTKALNTRLGKEGVFVEGLNIIKTNNYNEAIVLLEKAGRNRSVVKIMIRNRARIISTKHHREAIL